MNRDRLTGFAGVVVVVATLCIAGCGVPKLVVGSATVRVSEHLQVDIEEGGTVQYVGNPIVEQEVGGLGQIKRIGD